MKKKNFTKQTAQYHPAHNSVVIARKDNVHHVGHHVDSFFGGRAEICDVFVATFRSRELRNYWPTGMVSMTRSSADADNRLDAFSGQSRSTNMIPFHVLHVTALNVIPFLKSNIVEEAQLMLTNLRDG